MIGQGIDVVGMLDPSCDSQVGKSKTPLRLVNLQLADLDLAMAKLARLSPGLRERPGYWRLAGGIAAPRTQIQCSAVAA